VLNTLRVNKFHLAVFVFGKFNDEPGSVQAEGNNGKNNTVQHNDAEQVSALQIQGEFAIVTKGGVIHVVIGNLGHSPGAVQAKGNGGKDSLNKVKREQLATVAGEAEFFSIIAGTFQDVFSDFNHCPGSINTKGNTAENTLDKEQTPEVAEICNIKLKFLFLVSQVLV
jgi:hypothetical protein